jgi:glycosyltransferase involved in cell wall biosynthesis
VNADGHCVTVIIPTVGRPTIELCQAALAKQTRPPDHVIVSKDYERKGVAWARNQGIRRAKGDLIAFADDDGVPPPDWLERLIRALDKHNAAAAGGTFAETDPLLHEIRQTRGFPADERVDTNSWVGNTGNILFRREWLEACEQRYGHVFDEEMDHGEDFELILRLRSLGATFVFVPAAVQHLRRVTPWQFCRHQFGRGIGIALLHKSQRKFGPEVLRQESLIWGANRSGPAKWLVALWYKLLGPFNAGDFSTKRRFMVYWLGEKFQGAGFLWGMVRP